MRKFEKITQDNYEASCKNGIKYEEIKLPQRATRYSAGYDFYSVIDFTLKPGEKIKIPTGIRAFMNNDDFLAIYIRSSLGFKHDIRLSNSTGIIDADYVKANNEGHIFIALYNGGDNVVEIKKGEAFAQGIFQKYYLVDNEENVKNERNGGIGSTNLKN